jgi:ATP-dependent DNA helicase Rep
LWINNDDDPAFLRAVTTPKRGIGHQTLGQLGAFASQAKLSLFSSLFTFSLGSHLKPKAVSELHEFGRYINDLAFRAKGTVGETSAREFLKRWLTEINYEQHLYDGEESEKLAAARWANVSDFCDWMAARCGNTEGTSTLSEDFVEPKSLLDVAQTISLLSTLSEREQDQNVVTLSTLHASKGLEWPHVMLVGATEGMLPFKLGDDDTSHPSIESDAKNPIADRGAFAQRLQEERRLMYVGITRAQRSLAVSWTRKRKKGREMIGAQPSRFIAEMGLDQATVKEDPRAKLRALREEFARKTKEKN